MTYFIPYNLDIDWTLQNHPPLLGGFKKEHLLYIVDLITSIPAQNHALQLNNGYVPINAKLLQNKIVNYKFYLNYLIEKGIIETDNHYKLGVKSKGYRFCKEYATIIKTYEGLQSDNIKAHHPCMLLTSVQRKSYRHLTEWFNEGLQIDKGAAMDFIYKDYQSNSKNKLLREWEFINKKYKNPTHQFNCSIQMIERIAARTYFLNIDDTGLRLHTPLTNIRSELRNYITYATTKLVSIDIVNCQPFLCSLLFNPSFWEIKGRQLTISDINLSITDIFYSSSFFSSFIMLCKQKESCSNSDIHLFINKVSGGEFYEYMATALDCEHFKRKNLKASVFQVLFTDNRFIGQEDAAPKRMFRQIFPDVYQLLSCIKRNNKISLPMLLQRIESRLILQIITKRIAKEYADLPLFTIHDSVITEQGMQHYVKRIIEEETIKIFGYSPTMTIKHWAA
ncbi:MAG: hypothetical protein JST29_01515 [Bacteroidetes bacterium]|nr:hypothetical protein [Bacteroidota bacterium]